MIEILYNWSGHEIYRILMTTYRKNVDLLYDVYRILSFGTLFKIDIKTLPVLRHQYRLSFQKSYLSTRFDLA